MRHYQNISLCLRACLKRFYTQERGLITVESIIILPILLIALMATYTYFDVFRKQSLALKANYSVSDYLSRVPTYDQDAVEGLNSLFQFMSQSKSGNWLRVSVIECKLDAVQCNASPRKLDYNFDYSAVSQGQGVSKLTQAEVFAQYSDFIPKMYNGESLFIVETVAQYRPLMPTILAGIPARELKNTVVTGSRETDVLCFETPAQPCE